MSNRFLTANGTPASGPGSSPRASFASTRARIVQRTFRGDRRKGIEDRVTQWQSAPAPPRSTRRRRSRRLRTAAAIAKAPARPVRALSRQEHRGRFARVRQREFHDQRRHLRRSAAMFSSDAGAVRRVERQARSAPPRYRHRLPRSPVSVVHLLSSHATAATASAAASPAAREMARGEPAGADLAQRRHPAAAQIRGSAAAAVEAGRPRDRDRSGCAARRAARCALRRRARRPACGTADSSACV